MTCSCMSSCVTLTTLQVVYATVEEAVKDMHRVYATTVRVREVGRRVSVLWSRCVEPAPAMTGT